MTALSSTDAIVPSSAIREQVTFRGALDDMLVITRRNLTRVVRLPQLLLFSTIQPVMFLFLFNFVFGGAITQTMPGEAGAAMDGRYIIFLLPGLMVQISAFGAGQTAFGLAEDLSNGVIDRFRSLPMARSAVLAGRTVADLSRSAAVLALMSVIAVVLGFRYQTSFLGFLGGFTIVLLFAFALSWMTATVGLLVKTPEAVQSAVFLPVFPFVFASAVFVPTATMPGWLQAFANNQPVTHVANAARGLMIGPELLPPAHTVTSQVLVALAWIVGILVVFVPLAVRVYRRTVV